MYPKQLDRVVTLETRLMLYLTGNVFNNTSDFYSGVLNLPIRHQWDEGMGDRGVMFDAGSITIELIDHGQTREIGTAISVSLAVDDVWSLWHSIKNIYNEVGPLSDRSWGDTDFMVRDPAGFTLKFFSSTGTRNSNPGTNVSDMSA